MSTSNESSQASSSARKRVAVLDDHIMMRNGMKVFIDSLPEFECCWEAADCQSAMEKLEKDTPDVMLVDIPPAGPQRAGVRQGRTLHLSRVGDAGRVDA